MGNLKANSSGKLCSCSDKKLRACERWCYCRTDSTKCFQASVSLAPSGCADDCNVNVPLNFTMDLTTFVDDLSDYCYWQGIAGSGDHYYAVRLTHSYFSGGHQWAVDVWCMIPSYFPGSYTPMALFSSAHLNESQFSCDGTNVFVGQTIPYGECGSATVATITPLTCPS